MILLGGTKGEAKNMDEGLSKQEWQLFWITEQNVSFSSRTISP